MVALFPITSSDQDERKAGGRIAASRSFPDCHMLDQKLHFVMSPCLPSRRFQTFLGFLLLQIHSVAFLLLLQTHGAHSMSYFWFSCSFWLVESLSAFTRKWSSPSFAMERRPLSSLVKSKPESRWTVRPAKPRGPIAETSSGSDQNQTCQRGSVLTYLPNKPCGGS